MGKHKFSTGNAGCPIENLGHDEKSGLFKDADMSLQAGRVAYLSDRFRHAIKP